jgi:hypothetical protein
MKTILVACLFASGVAQAEVVECPKFYPWQDTPLAEVPFQHKGKGIVAKASLSGAGMYVGDFNGEGELQGVRKRVPNGYEVEYGGGSRPKWLVCSYGTSGDIRWWEQLDSQSATCKLAVREKGVDPISAKMVCK